MGVHDRPVGREGLPRPGQVDQASRRPARPRRCRSLLRLGGLGPQAPRQEGARALHRGPPAPRVARTAHSEHATATSSRPVPQAARSRRSGSLVEAPAVVQARPDPPPARHAACARRRDGRMQPQAEAAGDNAPKAEEGGGRRLRDCCSQGCHNLWLGEKEASQRAELRDSGLSFLSFFLSCSFFFWVMLSKRGNLPQVL